MIYAEMTYGLEEVPSPLVKVISDFKLITGDNIPFYVTLL